MNKKTVFITGGFGFIGRNLASFLARNFTVFVPSHAELDVLNLKSVRSYINKHSPEVIIHAANIGGKRDQAELSGVFEKNKEMFLNIAENLPSETRLIFLGSGAEYGKQNPIVKVKENDFGKVKPEDEYGKAKYFASEYIVTHPNIVNLRCFGVFGKYEDYTTRFLSNSICMALAGQPITIKQNAKFTYVYVKDLARIIEHFIINRPKEKFYNVGSGQNFELLQLAEIVKDFTGQPIEVLNPGMNKEYTCDSSLLAKELGDFQFTSIREAIKEMVEWHKEHWQSIDQSKLKNIYN